MFLLHLIPDQYLHWAVHAVVMAGVVIAILGSIFSHLPMISGYSNIAKWIGVLIFSIGLYLEGGYGTELEWRSRVEAAEAKVAVAEKASSEANDQLAVEHKKKMALLEERRVIYRERIKREIVKIDSECKLDPVVAEIHNEAAKNTKRKREAK
jgi:hypothetical protein